MLFWVLLVVAPPLAIFLWFIGFFDDD